MSETNELPSYAQPHGKVMLNQSTLAGGSIQEEAIRFFTRVAQQGAPEEIKKAFQAIIDDHPDFRRVRPFYDIQDNFLIATVALALLKDIGPLAPYITNDNVLLGSVSNLLKDFAEGIEIDLVGQLTRKGELELQMFCMVYSVSIEDIARKTVLEDNPLAFDAIHEADPALASKVLASVPYDPLSAIRFHFSGEAGAVKKQEMNARISDQYTRLYSDRRQMMNPAKPSTLQPGGKLGFEALDIVDHQLRLLPGYRSTLHTYQDEFLEAFSFDARQATSFNANQLKLIATLIDDMETAGITRVDILMKGILNFECTRDDLLVKVPRDTLKDRYLVMSQDERKALYLPMLVERAAYFGDRPETWQAQPTLIHLNHFIRKEPIEQLEALCTTSSHWNALYRATGDRKYVAKLGDRSERVLSEDLGL